MCCYYLDPEMRSQLAAPSPLSMHLPSSEDMNDSGISLDGEYYFHICYTKAMMYNVIKDVTCFKWKIKKSHLQPTQIFKDS